MTLTVLYINKETRKSKMNYGIRQGPICITIMHFVEWKGREGDGWGEGVGGGRQSVIPDSSILVDNLLEYI
jgi:hypothetical protein